MESRSVVTAWDAPRKFTSEAAGWFPGSPPIATEWSVEARAGGVCVVRVVQSLFASTDDWDDQLIGTESGIPGAFRILRLYLTHFRSERSAFMQFMAPVAGTPADAWATLTAALGFNGAGVGQEAIMAAHGERFDLLLGRRTYDAWSGFWPQAPSSPSADRLNAATKYIVTHRPESLAWGPFERVGPDIVEGIRRIKSQDGPDLILAGSSTLTSTVLEHGLADDVVLAVYPTVLGAGKRFFAEGTPACAFELVSTQAMPSGIVLSTYKVAGALKTA